MRLLERLLGPVDVDAREAIESLSHTQLLLLTDDLLNFEHMDDLRDWLARKQ